MGRLPVIMVIMVKFLTVSYTVSIFNYRHNRIRLPHFDKTHAQLPTWVCFALINMAAEGSDVLFSVF